MKTKQEIEARIKELYEKLQQISQTKANETFSQEQLMQSIHRLQGNIGSLEWVIRQ